MKRFLRTVREPEQGGSRRAYAAVCAALALGGLLLGILQKRLDAAAFNELPRLLQALDVTNYFGRFSVWILLGTALSVYAKTPFRAAGNTFLFMGSMVAGYYLYGRLALGFFPVSYALIWAAAAAASPFAAFVCWYAKGRGPVAVGISAVILGALFSQAVGLIGGIRLTHLPELLTWAAGLAVLRRKPKEFAATLALSLPVALLIQLCLPEWG